MNSEMQLQADVKLNVRYLSLAIISQYAFPFTVYKPEKEFFEYKRFST